jgi:hypothetical protein
MAELIEKLRYEADNCDLEDRLDLSRTADLLRKAATQIHELERTRSEGEAQARVAGYQEGQRDMRNSLRAMFGLEKLDA